MTTSKYQSAIYNEIQFGKHNICVNAVAGSGKTTTSVNALSLIPANAQSVFLAFNKAIVEELKTRVSSPNAEIKTLHSAGFQVLMRTYRSKLNNYKYRKFLNDSLFLLTKEVTIDTNAEDVNQYKNRILKLVDLVRVNLSYDKDSIEAIASKHEIDLELDEIEVVQKIIQWGQNIYKEVDFTDMIWLPVVKDLKIQQYDFVFVDEAQDLNNCQRELMLKMIKPNGGRFIAVGDPKQSINGFCGADIESFTKLANLPNTITLPLSVCYRCGKNIVESAKDIVPYIEANESSIDGEVRTVTDLTEVKENDMILCRVSAPLVSVCMKFIANGKPAYIKGKEIGGNLINLIKKTKQDDLMLMFDLLSNELYKISLKISKKEGVSVEEAKDDYTYIALADKIECLRLLSFGCSNSKDLMYKIEQLFKDNSKGICLSTCHKSKGLEADNVYIIAPDKLPLKRCMSVEWKAEQEMNLKYVSITRAKKVLNWVDCEISKLKVVK